MGGLWNARPIRRTATVLQSCKRIINGRDATDVDHTFSDRAPPPCTLPYMPIGRVSTRLRLSFWVRGCLFACQAAYLFMLISLYHNPCLHVCDVPFELSIRQVEACHSGTFIEMLGKEVQKYQSRIERASLPYFL